MYTASQPHGWSAASTRAQKGIVSCALSSKYHASDGMSYSTSTAAPRATVPIVASTRQTREMK
jgi:hypothetical protein